MYFMKCSYPPPPIWISTAGEARSPPGMRIRLSSRWVTAWNCTLL